MARPTQARRAPKRVLCGSGPVLSRLINDGNPTEKTVRRKWQRHEAWLPSACGVISAATDSLALDERRLSHLRLVEPADAEFICALRSDAKLSRFLNAPETTVAEQRSWIEGYKIREGRGQEYYFVIVHGGTDRGVVRIYDFRPIEGLLSFCWGSWIIAPPPIAGLATYSALMIYELGFIVLGFERCHFDVRRGNRKVIAFHERSGAQVVGEDADNLYFSFSRRAHLSFFAAHERERVAHQQPWPG